MHGRLYAGDSGGAGRFCCEETHKPTSGADRGATFQMKSGVAIYGEVDPAAGRNWQVFAGSRSPGQTVPCYTG